MPNRIADTLVLTFTSGVSLDQWQRSGSLSREWVLYEKLRANYNRILLITYGSAADREIVAQLNASGSGARIEILTNDLSLPLHEFAAAICEPAAEQLKGDASVVIKTNQYDGGEVAARLARHLRDRGAQVGLIARGGYDWSRFTARRFGADSPIAQNAAAREGSLCRAADLVIAPTQSIADDLIWRHALPGDRAQVIPNYILLDQPHAAPRDENLILCAGRLDSQKRTHLLIEAIAILARRANIKAPTLAVVGAGELDPQLRAQAKNCGAKVEFLGNLEHFELRKHMRRCAIFAQVSAYEGHPKTIIEAQASASPVLVTDAPSLTAVVRHNETGIVTSAKPANIAAAIAQLLGDSPLRTRLGAAAERSATEEYSLDRVITLERAAHTESLTRGAQPRPTAASPVRWDADLLDVPVADAVGEWARSINGYTRRLSARRRAEFLMALDEPLYLMQGRSAIDANGGLHPKHHLMRYHDFFVEHILPGERIIDLGSGVGALACSVAQNRDATIIGVEIEPENIRAAEARVAEQNLQKRISFIKGDITTTRVPGKFDAVILSNVLEHVPDRAKLLRMWREWYSPSRFLIRVPAFDRDWRTPWKRELGLEWRLDDTHEIEYTLESLRQELRDADLELTELIANWGEYWLVAIAGAHAPLRA